MMIKKVLIANRGEIAVRIIQACQELHIQTVAVFSEPDRESLHVKLADEAYCIGPATASESYLNIENLIKVAVLTNVDAIHPGYGFLAENAEFVSMCEAFNITFIGPTVEAIKLMGIKDIARQTMAKADIPITPGSNGLVTSDEEAIEIAETIGYPIIIKATAGGGGKGIRMANDRDSLLREMKVTRQEALTSFGNPGIYLEKYIENFRHIEVQIIADAFGNIVHLGERDCTVQRRMQKLVEETPSPVISDETREKMGQTAVRAANAVNYVGAGTVEFIYDLNSDNFYFMEMNTRIQVEHPITEMVTGIDLVKEQIRIASGKQLQVAQKDIVLSGCSIECRINAEDPDNHFLPSPGVVTNYIVPGGYGVRVDSAVYPGYNIQPFYDSLIAKLIVHGDNRNDAIQKMKRALNHFNIEGIHTTIPFFLNLFSHEIFINGEYNTKFLENHDVRNQKTSGSES